MSNSGEGESKVAIKREKREKHEKADKKEKPVKTKSVHRKSNWILYIAVVALVLYIAVTIVDQNVKIREARQELSELNQQINLKIIELDEKKKVADAAEKNDFDSFSEYIERIARQRDYVKPGEKVYINIAGD